MADKKTKPENPAEPSKKTIKQLFARSGNRCAFPKCPVEIVQNETVVGEICHIKSAKPEGPRYDARQTPTERHCYDNLILCCPTHHTVIDDDEEAYTVERLIKIKRDHEQRASPMKDNQVEEGTQLLIDQAVTTINQSGGITAHTILVDTINVYASHPTYEPEELRPFFSDSTNIERPTGRSAPTLEEPLAWIIRTEWGQDRNRIQCKLEEMCGIDSFVLVGMEDTAAPLEAEVLGLLALNNIWYPRGRSGPSHSEVDQHLHRLEVLRKEPACLSILMKARERKLIYGQHLEFSEAAFAIALAADHMLSWFSKEADLGKELTLWMLDHIEGLKNMEASPKSGAPSGERPENGPYRIQLLVLLLIWCAEGKERLAQWELGKLNSDPVSLSISTRDRILRSMCVHDRLMDELDLAPWKNTRKDPPSIQWAYKAGLSNSVSSVLEFLRENRVGIYQDHLARLTGDPQIHVLRSMIKLIDKSGKHGSICGGSLECIMRACSQHASKADIDGIRHDKRLSRKCLKVLSKPVVDSLNEYQMDLLIELYTGKVKGQKQAQMRRLVGRCLCANTDPAIVWKRLNGTDLQVEWAHDLRSNDICLSKLEGLIKHLEEESISSPIARDALRLLLHPESEAIPM